MRPLLRSYGLSSTSTLSPGTTRMKFMRIFPEMCARTACPFWSSTLNMALGRASETVPSTSITSLFDGLLLANPSPDAAWPAVTAHGNQNCTQIAHTCRCLTAIHAATAAFPAGAVSTTGPLARSEEHTSELQSRGHLVCRLLL